MLWEEIGRARHGGENFGWPCYEGLGAQPDYQAATPAHHDCGTLGTPENPAAHSPPIAVYHHQDPGLSVPAGARGGAVVGGTFYTGASYPGWYHGAYFFGDYLRGWIKAMRTDENDQPIEVMDFATGADGPVSFATDPLTGDLWYAAIFTGEVHRIRYTGVVSAGPGPAPTRVALSRARPNPTRAQASFELDLPVGSDVRFEVFDVAGRRVWGTASPRPAGRSGLVWPGLDAAGAPARAGLYLVRVTAGADRFERRVLMLP
jgi:hypothetical protein